MTPASTRHRDMEGCDHPWNPTAGWVVNVTTGITPANETSTTHIGVFAFASGPLSFTTCGFRGHLSYQGAAATLLTSSAAFTDATFSSNRAVVGSAVAASVGSAVAMSSCTIDSPRFSPSSAITTVYGNLTLVDVTLRPNFSFALRNYGVHAFGSAVRASSLLHPLSVMLSHNASLSSPAAGSVDVWIRYRAFGCDCDCRVFAR